VRTVDLDPGNEEAVRQAAALLVEGFEEHWPNAWPNMESALETVRESFGEDYISLAAVDEGGTVLGWIGGMGSYGGKLWEVPPPGVRRDLPRRGIGGAPVGRPGESVRGRPAFTLLLGTHDEKGM